MVDWSVEREFLRLDLKRVGERIILSSFFLFKTAHFMVLLI